MALVDKSGLSAGIVHLGIGAFARAHLIPATEAAMAASGERHWGVLGVSLRRADVRDALAPQGFDYILALRDADEHGQPRERRETLRSLLGVLVSTATPPTSISMSRRSTAHEPQKNVAFQKSLPSCTRP